MDVRLYHSSEVLEDGSSFVLFLLRNARKGTEENGAEQPDRAAPRNPWPIIRFFAHSRSWASGRRSLSLGEKSKSATLPAKECERNRFLNSSLNTESQRHKGTEMRADGMFGLCDTVSLCLCVKTSAPALERVVRFRSYSFNRGAADLDGFAIANERDLNAHGSEWRKRRTIGRIRLRRSVDRFRFLPSISAHSVVKNGWRTGRSSRGQFVFCCVFTTEMTEGSGKNGTEQPTSPENAADYTSSRPLASLGLQVGVRCQWARTLNRPRLGLKSGNGKSVARGNACRLIETNTAVRFRFHSFARSVADLGFSPDGNWIRHEIHEGKWARNRIIGHGFRTGARTGWLIPYFPFLSVSSVVKKPGLTVPFPSADFRAFRSKKHPSFSVPPCLCASVLKYPASQSPAQCQNPVNELVA